MIKIIIPVYFIQSLHIYTFSLALSDDFDFIFGKMMRFPQQCDEDAANGHRVGGGRKKLAAAGTVQLQSQWQPKVTAVNVPAVPGCIPVLLGSGAKPVAWEPADLDSVLGFAIAS